MIAAGRHIRTIKMVATALAVATIAISCKGKLGKADPLDMENTPMQTVDNMMAFQSENGVMGMRMEAPLMEKYSKDDNNSYEIFPNGFNVYGYNEEGLLETEITSLAAKHTISGDKETWAAYGDVVIKNYIKGEQMETDTIYWDQKEKKIFTDCYVKLFSPQGLMQGYGMESDEMARNAVLLRPFDSYTIINSDTTKVSYVDSANFIGPLYKR